MNKSNNEQSLKQKELTRIREAAARLAISADERDPYTQAEGRLYALPMIRARLECSRDERDELASLGIEALREHSRSLVRLLSPSMRLTPEEIHEAQLAELGARIAADEREVGYMERALAYIEEHPYFEIIKLKYFKCMTDAAIAERLSCDVSTIRRNRKRLVQSVALFLYGSAALSAQMRR